MIICFDVTRKKTFDSVRRWAEACQTNCETGIPLILVGNKCDLDDERQVETSEAKQIATDLGNIKYFEVSAKSNINIADVFEEIVDQVYNQRFAPKDDQNKTPVENKPREGTFKLNSAKAAEEKPKEKEKCKC